MTPSRFDYVAYDDRSNELSSQFKETFAKLEAQVAGLAEGRAKSLILTKLEEGYMWVGKAIRDDQIKRQTNS